MSAPQVIQHRHTTVIHLQHVKTLEVVMSVYVMKDTLEMEKLATVQVSRRIWFYFSVEISFRFKCKVKLCRIPGLFE